MAEYILLHLWLCGFDVGLAISLLVILCSWLRLRLRFLGSNLTVDAARVFGAVVGGGSGGTVRFVDTFGSGLEDGVLVLVLGLFLGDAG
jgi:hypothetical protein